MASIPALPCVAVAKYEYKSTEDGELSLKKAEQVTVEQINESGWCLATSGDKTGWVPATYLELGKSSLQKPAKPTKAPPAALAVNVDSASKTRSGSKPASTPKVGSTTTTPASTPSTKPSASLSPPPSSTTTRGSTSKSPAAKSPPPSKPEPTSKTPASSSIRKGSKPIKAAATYEDDMPPPPPPPPGEMMPPPPAPEGDLPDELRGDDADTTPESSDNEEEKPKQPLRRRKKLQDIMQSEKEIAANEIFKMFDDRDDDFDVNADGEFDQDKWISEMLDTEDDPPPPPDVPDDDGDEPTPTKSPPKTDHKSSAKKTQKSPQKFKRSETIAERERARTELQTAISLDKKKKVEKGVTNLDLSYVTDRIIAMGCPSESGATKNNITNYRKFFKQYHDNHIRIYNLAAGKTYGAEKMKPIPVNTSFQFEAGNVPAFHSLLDACKSLTDWLGNDELNVAALHCNEGARTGLIVCCYLLFTNICNSGAQALRYYAAFRGKEAMSGMCPSQVRYLNYFETYAVLAKQKTDSGALSGFLPQQDEEPTTPVKPGSVRETRSPSTKGPVLLRRSVLDFLLPNQTVYLKELTLAGVPQRFASDSIWFRITHPEFNYESKGRLRAVQNIKQAKLQFVIKDKSDKAAPPIMNGDVRLEIFNAKGLRNEKILQCWFNTRFLEDADMDETVEESLEAMKQLEAKSISKWDAEDKRLYQEAMEIVRKYRRKEALSPDGGGTPQTPGGGDFKDKHMPAVWDEVEIEGRDYDVLQLHLDKKKLDGICTDAKNKIAPNEFSISLTFHRPKQREAPPARSMSPPPTKGHK